MSYYVGDEGPLAVPFSVATGDVDGTEVDSVRVFVYRPSGVTPREIEWSPGGLTKTESTVEFVAALQSDGSSLPAAGEYYCRVWLYDVSDVLLFATDEQLLFTVKARRIVGPA